MAARVASRAFGECKHGTATLYTLRNARAFAAAAGTELPGTADLASLEPLWLSAAVWGLANSVRDSVIYGYEFRSWDSLARVRLAVGYDEEFVFEPEFAGFRGITKTVSYTHLTLPTKA